MSKHELLAHCVVLRVKYIIKDVNYGGAFSESDDGDLSL